MHAGCDCSLNYVFYFLQCKTFLELVESEEDYESKSVTAVGVLQTIRVIMEELDEQEEVCKIDFSCIPFACNNLGMSNEDEKVIGIEGSDI